MVAQPARVVQRVASVKLQYPPDALWHRVFFVEEMLGNGSIRRVMNRPTPSAIYREQQQELRELTEANVPTGRKLRLQRSLEKMFVEAWGFDRDHRRLSYGLGMRLQSSGLDHCTYYAGALDERVIVTQPYGEFASELRRDFTLDDGTAPEVIEASDWAFYYPGHASLVVLVFPFNYSKLRDQNAERLRRAKLEAARDCECTH